MKQQKYKYMDCVNLLLHFEEARKKCRKHQKILIFWRKIYVFFRVDML